MDLLQNPFYILGATPRDNRRKIIELSEERCLVIDSNEISRARLALTHPKKRLSAEIAWLPGVAPKRVKEVLDFLDGAVNNILDTTQITSVARANMLAAGLSRLTSKNNPEEIAKWILDLAWAFEKVEPEDLRTTINEERVVSDFPEVADISAVEAEVQERRIYYRKIIKSALDNLHSKDLVKAVTIVVESVTDEGKGQAPVLIDDLVDMYEIGAQPFLEKEGKNIEILVNKIHQTADAEKSDAVLEKFMAQLIQVVKNWNSVALPIQVSTKSRGLTHNASLRIASIVRGLAIDLFNEHDKLDLSQRLTKILQKVFAEVAEVAEHTAEDASVLDEIAERRKRSHLLDPIFAICTAALETTKVNPALADKEAHNVAKQAAQLVSSLEDSKPSNEILSYGKDQIALTLMHCAVVYGNETEIWKPCISILEEALKYASSEEVKNRIHENLETVRENEKHLGGLKPISSAPTLYTFNGIGTALYGASDHDDATGSYLSTYYFVALFIPLFPICRYRVIPTDEGYVFIGKAPLRTFDKLHIVIFVGLIIWMFVHGL